MSIPEEIPDKKTLDRLADESGVAVVFVDENQREIFATNNNSICRNLNPQGNLVGQCAAFCGTALEETAEVGGSVSFTCHAGLECRAIPIQRSNAKLVAIVGRTFIKAENYRRATARAISGDWGAFPPSDFFENILLTGSQDILDKVARQMESLVGKSPAVEPVVVGPPVVAAELLLPLEAATRPPKAPPETTSIVEKFKREIRGKKPIELIKSDVKPELNPPEATKAEPVSESKPISEPIAASDPQPEPARQATPEQADRRMAESRAWRSFFGSLLKMDYPKATDSILEFLAHHYGFSALIWLERVGDSFENTAAFGDMKNRKVRLGIAPDDPRLIAASQKELPL